MQTTTELSIEIMYRIKEMLNQEIRDSGEIQINNKTIWDGFLHQMPNEAWRGCLETLEQLAQQHPHLFELSHITAIREGLALLDKHDQYYDRVLDMNNRHVKAKKTAWKCLMTIREVWNKCVGEYLPNHDSSRVRSTYHSIFDVE